MSDCACDGSGAIRYVERQPDDTRTPIGHGLTLDPMTTYGTHLCACRRSLEPREGHARWWTSESVFSGEWASSVHSHTADVSVTAEVPVSEDNYVVERRGNRYYPTMIDIDLSEDWLHALFPDEVRKLAQLLVEAADAADAIDEPCADTCGHRAPCGCGMSS